MKNMLRKSFGLAAVLAVLAGPALADPYDYGNHDQARHYGARSDEHGGWRHFAMWRAHDRQDEGNGYSYHRDNEDRDSSGWRQ
ncbi:hypothetical protein [Acidocella sp.]|uniref:hypothetical protein n=1 Tax=Acidocella sp. TaxID=50710 RepID=UPI00262184D1|nr:hypothetical protein [Acidocella sp.]